MNNIEIINENIKKLQSDLAELEGPWKNYIDEYLKLRLDPNKTNSTEAQMIFFQIMECQFKIRAITDKINALERLLYNGNDVLKNEFNNTHNDSEDETFKL